jgi:hypothetical protein
MKFFGWIIAKFLRSKLDLEEGPMTDTKKWYKSRTIWGGVYVILRGVYEGVSAYLAPQLGWTLPPVPPVVDTIVAGIVGEEIIRGRVRADTKIAA